MNARLSAYATLNAPRYTSYPTAPQFSTAIGPPQMAAWLQHAGAADAPLSLYVHVPFCREICWYCGCNTKAARRRDVIEAYVETVRSEIALAGSFAGRPAAGRLHWGGGTPHALLPDDLLRVHQSLAENFNLGDLNEHAVEIDPRALDAGHVRTFATIGINRASIGVQDFNDHVQRAIGRIQPYALVDAAVQQLSDAGIARLSFDIVYGLPQQSLDDVRRSVDLALTLRPDRFSVFGYAHVPWMKARQRLIDVAKLPGGALRASQEAAVREMLVGTGYEPIGLDHFALPSDSLAIAARTSRLRRNFQGYVDDDCIALIGFGPSAISHLPAGYTQNAADVGAWTRAIRDGAFATARGHALTAEDTKRGAIIERLMCAYQVDLSEFGGTHLYPDAFDYLEPLLADALVVRDEGKLTVPTEARGLIRLAAQAFDAYRTTTDARYSRVV